MNSTSQLGHYLVTAQPDVLSSDDEELYHRVVNNRHRRYSAITSPITHPNALVEGVSRPPC
jgi:hypothetical protein